MFDVIGSIAGGLIGSSSAKKANKAAAREAELNREFQREMAQNAHQYEVEDLRKAGLNPILSAGGSGASASGGAGNAAVLNEGDSIATGVSTALQAAIAKANIQNIKADTQQKAANTQLANKQIDTQDTVQALNLAGAQSAAASAALSNTQNIKESRMSPIHEAIGKASKWATDTLGRHYTDLKNFRESLRSRRLHSAK